MELGPNTSFLVEFLSHIDIDGRVIVLADLAELGHGYKAGDMLKAYKELKAVCESWDIESIDEFKANIVEFVEERYLSIRSKLGSSAMSNVIPISEEDKDKDKDKDDNKEKFEKEAEKQKKAEHSPIAKATRSKGQNQDDMAASTHVDKSTVSRWKTGKRKPSFDNLKKLKSQYGMAVVNQLLGT